VGAPFGALTFATRVELLSDGFASGANETNVAIAVAGTANTEMLMGAEVLPAKGPFASKVAVMECEPAARDAVLKLVLPAASNENVPSKTFPS